MNTIKSVGVLIIDNNSVLLVRHKKGASHLTGVYGLPAGRVEENETEKQAAIRELGEETGLVTTEENLSINPQNVYTNVAIPRKDGTIQYFDFTVFTCKSYSGEVSSSDESEPEWVHIDKLKEYNLLPNVKEIIEREIK